LQFFYIYNKLYRPSQLHTTWKNYDLSLSPDARTANEDVTKSNRNSIS